jgi:glycosyltransferase involved in cell wall biosynthesis
MLTTRRRVLVLTPRDPYSGIGGDRLRIHRLARELSKHHDLTLLTLCRSLHEHSEPNDGVFKQIHRIVLPAWKSWLNTLMAIPTSNPLQVAYYRSRAFQDAFDALAPDHDAVVAHLVRTAGYVKGYPAVRILEMTDAISMSMERVSQVRSGYFDWRQMVYRLEGRRLAAHERKLVSEFDLVSLTTAIDCNYLLESPSSVFPNVIVIPNGSDIPQRTPEPQISRGFHEIAFVGNVQSLQNFDAVWFFAHKVLPLVRAQLPQAVLRVIGPIGRIARRRLSSVQGVIVEGIVPNLAAALTTARVGVCPVRTGSGIKNKVLDYFANGVATVCTPQSLSGIDARHGEHVLLADSPEEWASSVSHLLADHAAAQRLADASRALVCQQHRWDDCVGPLLSHMNLLLSGQETQTLPSAREIASAGMAA